jgi:hypothetical protein
VALDKRGLSGQFEQRLILIPREIAEIEIVQVVVRTYSLFLRESG